jgi:hypothetical protein
VRVKPLVGQPVAQVVVAVLVMEAGRMVLHLPLVLRTDLAVASFEAAGAMASPETVECSQEQRLVVEAVLQLGAYQRVFQVWNLVRQVAHTHHKTERKDPRSHRSVCISVQSKVHCWVLG